jgi:peptidyl-prolyl cis-trans isomerase B (cyclophilin B)
VFGKVIRGTDVVDRIAGVETGGRSGHRDVPLEPVFITGAVLLR